MEYGYLKYMPSLLGAAAVYLAHQATNTGKINWNEKINSEVGHSEEEVKPLVKEMISSMQAQEKSDYQAARKKYSQRKYMEVSKMKIDYTY